MTETTYDTSKHIIATLIEEAEIGPYKVSDKTFVEICEAYNMTEESVMELMIAMPRQSGKFMRVADGFIFIENELHYANLEEDYLDASRIILKNNC